MSKVHLVTQRNQPHGSRRGCCEICGLSMYTPGFRYTGNPELFEIHEDACNQEPRKRHLRLVK